MAQQQQLQQQQQAQLQVQQQQQHLMVATATATGTVTAGMASPPEAIQMDEELQELPTRLRRWVQAHFNDAAFFTHQAEEVSASTP